MVSTPIIFYGSDYESVLEKARSFGKELAPTTDFFELTIEGKNYTKEQIIEFLKDVPLTPYQGTHKVYLFPMADRMLPVHANALLKTFEEKPNHVIILLATDNIKGVIETILSRCKKVRVSESTGEMAISPLFQEALLKREITCLEEIPLEEAIYTFLTLAKEQQMPFIQANAYVRTARAASDCYTKPKLILEYLLMVSAFYAIQRF